MIDELSAGVMGICIAGWLKGLGNGAYFDLFGKKFSDSASYYTT